MTTRFSVFLGAAILLVTLSPTLPAAKPSYFRRDSGLAITRHALPADFDKGARQVWRCELAPGNSSPCVVQDLVVLTTVDKDTSQLATVAIDRKSGKVRWRQVLKTKKIESYHPVGSPASCTVASNGEQLFVFFGSFGMLSYDLHGKLLWQKLMGPFQDEFGASSSPVLADGLILLNEDHDVDSFLMAIDQQTGKTVWSTPREGFTRSYSTPVIWEQDGQKQVVVAGSLQLAGYDLKTGKKQWWVDGLSRIVDSTPNLADGRLFVATWTPGGDTSNRIRMEPYAAALKSFDKNKDGLIAKTELPAGPVLTRFFRIDLDQDEKLSKAEWDNHARVFERAQNVAMSVKPQGTGDITDTSVEWVYRRGLPTVPSSVVYEGVMYMVRDGGVITSLDAKDGQLLQQGRAEGPGNYYASLVAGDHKVYLCSERGVITILKAGREWEVLSSHDFKERIMATPVVQQGDFFIRTDAALYCYQAR